MKTWQHQLVLQRICELGDAKFKAFSFPRFGTEGSVFYGTPSEVKDLIGAAIRAYEADDLPRADALCERAEAAILEGRIDGPCSHLSYEDLQRLRIDASMSPVSEQTK
jgi:hypothetical protein